MRLTSFSSLDSGLSSDLGDPLRASMIESWDDDLVMVGNLYLKDTE